VRPTRRLDDLSDTAARRALRLLDLAQTHRPSRPDGWSVADQRAMSYVLIEAANLWEAYCRAFYLSTALRARNYTGQRVTLTYGQPIRSLTDAITVAVHLNDSRMRKRVGPWAPRDEPDWSSGGFLSKVLRHLGADNLGEVNRAVGLLPGALADLRRTRTYFAHKGERSSQSVARLTREYGFTLPLDPMTLVWSPAPRRLRPSAADPIVIRWLDVLYRTLRMTCEPVP
jgi:hypothetical protein